MKRISTAIHRCALILLCMALLPACASAGAFYATAQGRYYHSDAHCSGMQNASALTVEDAMLSGKLPCPLCVAGTYYATRQGKYYHLDEHCQGMQNATAHAASEASADGKLPCPLCVGDGGLNNR